MHHPSQAHICVVYDGIGSSVFPGQVLAPLRTYHTENPQTPIYILSFEYARDMARAHTRAKSMHCTAHALRTLTTSRYTHTPNTITVIFCRKYPFIGSINLWLAARLLKKVLRKFTHYSICARGPLAGAIALRAAEKTRCTELIIQARGLVAAEYTYNHIHSDTVSTNKKVQRWKNFLRSICSHIRALQFAHLEHAVYQLNTDLPATIQAVSTALQTYLIQTFDAPADKITIALHDFPSQIPQEQRSQWRHEVRSELGIPTTAYLYCYSGSVKPWQCPDITITFFKQQLRTNQNSYLLVLTQDQHQFIQLLKTSMIPTIHYRILTVAHTDIYRYLAACDTGILFRIPHIVNWVSRPTKALEYQAAGLTIAHNNTVAWLQEDQKIARNTCDQISNPAIIAERRLDNNPPSTA